MMDMNSTKKPRDKGVKLPSWFIEKCREIQDERKKRDGESLTALARLLSDAAQRKKPWGHGEVSRFLDEKVTTAPMAEAFAIVFMIPRPQYTPRSYNEALAMELVARRYDGDRPNPDQSRRIEAFDHAVQLADVEIRGQTRALASQDERAAGSRRPGRAARSRS